MLTDLQWMSYAENLKIQLLQSCQEGRETTGFAEKIEAVMNFEGSFSLREALAAALHDELANAPMRADFPYDEPSGLPSILAARPAAEHSKALLELTPEALYDKIYGAWLGRCCGCLLGQPIEGWERPLILGLLKDTGNYPVSYYISSDIPTEIREKYNVTDDKKVYSNPVTTWINNISHMPEDDDTNYTLVALKLLEERGMDFTPEDVAEIWLDCLPFSHTCTAERAAYRNFVSLLSPPESASFRNPYREWIGAQIRGDLFGYVTPGDPECGAELAFRDGSISHTKNGIYGEMFIAAMLSKAAATGDISEIIRAGLNEIPEKSRLYEKITQVMNTDYSGWEEALEAVHKDYNEENIHDWCHTISNAVIVVISLLYGRLDLEKSLGIAISAAFDTDCNGATVGSIVGMVVGAKKLPEKWTAPLHDKIRSGVDGMGLVSISEIAARTARLVRQER